MSQFKVPKITDLCDDLLWMVGEEVLLRRRQNQEYRENYDKVLDAFKGTS